MSVSILTYIPSAQHAAIAARTSTYDSSADFQSAINALTTLGGTLYIPAGKYRLNSTLDNKPNVCLLGDGPDASTLEWASTHNGHGIRCLSAVNGVT
ncbi:MAG: Pectate lyase superfamily protein, partial [Sphingomonadales bacterium]|nr:Pectate lyase superfamily protein [Sphingomonadales bacterium]